MNRIFSALLLLSIVLPCISHAQGRQPIRLRHGLLAPGSELTNHRFNYPGWQTARSGDKYVVILQLMRPLLMSEKQQLQEHGISIANILATNTYLASVSTETDYTYLSRHSKAVFAIPAGSKIDPRLEATIPSGPDDLIALAFYPGADAEKIRAAVAAAGASIRDTRIKPPNTVFIKAGKNAIVQLAKLPFVISLAPLHLKDVILNNNNRAEHAIDAMASTSGRNLRGRGVTVGIGDNADPGSHVDFSGRLIMRTDEPVDYHGTHTAGSLAGGGILNPVYRGMAPHAKLITNDFSNIIVNSPYYFKDFRMTLSNNSYYNGDAGCTGEGEYNSLSSYTDDQLLAYPKLLHIFAAGNDGSNTCSPYPASFATVKSGFQAAKNVLDVGNLNAYTNAPSYYSSRGPVSDGRIKPEIIAGGSYITSTIPNNQYGVMSGTSMAAPTVTGTLAIIEERYHQLNGGADPDGGLMKSLLCNSADDWGNDGPDYTYGFGIMNARTTVEALEQHRYTKDSVSQGDIKTITIPGIPAGTTRVKIMLYWNDPAAAPLATQALVNDLDLSASDPSGGNHLPLILNANPANVNDPAAEGPDRINNIEQIVIKNPAAGNVTVQVKGYSVSQGPQTYYLTWEVIQPSITVEFPTGSEPVVPGGAEYIHWNANGYETNTFTIEYSTNGGGSWATINNAVPATARNITWTPPAVPTGNALVRVTRNGTGISAVSDYPFTILGQPALTVSNPCVGYAQLVWNTIAGADSYQVTQLTGDSMRVIATTTDTTFMVTPLSKDSTYWFSVQPMIGGQAGLRAVAGSIIPSGGSCNLAGLNNDLIVDPVLSPATGRQFTSTQLGITQIQLPIRNSGTTSIPGPTTFNYQVNGGPVVTEVYTSTLPGHIAGTYYFSPSSAYDFSAPGVYVIKAWVNNAADPTSANDSSVIRIKQLRNDPITLAPAFTEGFESALPQTMNARTLGLDSLDRADFGPSNSNGRANTFFDSGFPRTGNRCITLDVGTQGTPAADSTITTFNLSNYTPADQIWLDIYFKKQSALANYNGNRIWIRGQDNAAWIAVKNLNNSLEPAGTYIHVNVEVTGTLAGASPAQTISSSFQVRMGSEGFLPAASSDPAATPGGGISFDDITLTRAMNDVAMRALVQPVLKNICNLSSSEQVAVIVRNYSVDTFTNVPVTYAINNDTITEMIPVLYPKDSLVYTFSHAVDMSAYGSYAIRAWVAFPGDNYQSNDSLNQILIQTTPVIDSFPYLQTFEASNGYWFGGGQNSNWQWGVPAKKIIHKAASGTKAWVTNLTGNYSDNQYSFLYSPCFDLTSMISPVFSFSHIFKMEDDCDCDFHWVEYSLDDSSWTRFGQVDSGVNWYDNATYWAWQASVPRWHVSSYDVPVKPPKIRFRIVMFSDPGTNDEGVGIDDIHVFEKVPVYTDSLNVLLTQPVSDSGWVDFDKNGHRLFSLRSHGQDLGNVTLRQFLDSGSVRDTAGQYFLNRSWVIQPQIAPVDSVDLRFYFTDSEALKMITATSCTGCVAPEDAYVNGITRYSSLAAEEDSTMRNNLKGRYLFYKPASQVQVVPYDNGYYAQLTVTGFSEFRMNAGGRNNDHPLAAWLDSFSGKTVDTTALLSWITWQEAIAGRFIVQRSFDSLHFDSISLESATAHTDSLYSHSFTDKRMMPGINYYRVLYLQGNGDSLYSQILKLNFKVKPDTTIILPPNGLVIGVYPNPTDGPLSVVSGSPMRRIHVLDAAGRLLIDKAATGKNQVISISNLSRGIYLVEFWTESGKQLVRIEKR